MDFLESWVDKLLLNTGLSETWAINLRLLIFILILCLLSITLFLITKKIIIHYIYKLFKKSTLKWDDILAEKQVFNNVAHLVPAILVLIMAPTIFADFKNALPFITKLADAYLTLIGISIFMSFLKAAEYALGTHEAFKDKPLSSYFQLFNIILYIVGIIVVLSILLGKSPIYFLSAFGAMTAILLLIFKDTILGLVASVQISANDMVKVGDWVEMPKFNADGDVVAINLNTVKVQNWDLTITTIPTYYFITDSFKNWRGMQQSGGRRIKRSIYIDAHTIKFITPEIRETLKRYQLITDYIENRQKEIDSYNEVNVRDSSILINGRRMTNLGVFRKYIEQYLTHNPRIKKDMTIMVRQLASESKGIPIEIYCFTNTTEWLQYEGIQSDVFDHLYSTAKFFDLEIFQEPGGKDMREAFKSKF
ncbi:MAG: mechanosensitive ion channel [Bacteroidia bacterium]|nr:mechanosensitive ion channel [Bacteroidia bacterium]